MMANERNEERGVEVLLGLGANVDRERNLGRARGMLRTRFPAIRFSEPVYTAPEDFPFPEPFLNQVALLYTDEAPEEVAAALKRIERAVGRRPEDKARGRVPIDIDLLCWDGRVLRPGDMARAYVREGMLGLGKRF